MSKIDQKNKIMTGTYKNVFLESVIVLVTILHTFCIVKNLLL